MHAASSTHGHYWNSNIYAEGIEYHHMVIVPDPALITSLWCQHLFARQHCTISWAQLDLFAFGGRSPTTET